MSWDCLSAEVSVMFDDLTWRTNEHQLTLESYVARILHERQQYAQSPTRKRSVARARDAWRERNPELNKERNREYVRRWRAKQRKKRAEERRMKRLSEAGRKGALAGARNRLNAAKAEIRRRMKSNRTTGDA